MSLAITYDKYLIKDPKIYLSEIVSFELYMYEAHKGRDIGNGYLQELLDIIYEVSGQNTELIMEYDAKDSYFIRNLLVYSNTSTIYDLLKLGYFIKDNKIISFNEGYEFSKDSRYFSFMFALKLRQYYSDISLIESFLAYHLKNSFSNRNVEYYKFLDDELLYAYSDLYKEVYIQKLKTEIKHFEFNNKQAETQNSNDNNRLTPHINRTQINNYFLRFTKPFGKDNMPILSEEDLFIFLNANFKQFSHGESYRSYAKIEFQKSKVKSIVKRYFYEFANKYINSTRKETMRQYALALKDSFTAYSDISDDNMAHRFSDPRPKAYNIFLKETK